MFKSASFLLASDVSNSAPVVRQGMLLVLPAPLRRVDDRLFLEAQACNGIEQWANHFGHVVVAAPLLPEPMVAKEPTISWRDTATLAQCHRFEIVELPWAYKLNLFVQHYWPTRKLLASLIDRCQYLQFPMGGVLGDWAAIAAIEAHRQGRPYAVHTDLVEDQAILQLAKDKHLIKQLKDRVLAQFAEVYYKKIIQRSSLALLHGEDCYAAYRDFCPNSFLVHDTHTKPDDTIADAELEAKLQAVPSDRALKICYVGRMKPMKAPLDWVRAIGKARDLGVPVQATWLGDGELLADVQALVAELGLEDWIELPGYVGDRQVLLHHLRSAHVLMFTHITPESPRCLVEAFVSGTPIVGYHSRYAQNLSEAGGSVLVPVGDWSQLAEKLATIWSDRSSLVELIRQAATQRDRFNDQAVFRERSELIKRHL